MKAKFYVFLILAFLVFQLNALGQITGPIVFISNNEIDSGFVQVLEANHYEVIVLRSYFNGLFDPDTVAAFDGAAFIIYSRNNPSANFAGSAEVNNLWNDLDIPLLCLSPFPLRSEDR